MQVAPKVVCKGVQHLEEHYQDIIDKGGEGVILRDPIAPYHSGRCPGFLKHKVTPDSLADSPSHHPSTPISPIEIQRR